MTTATEDRTAAEIIQTAIDVLEGMKTQATPGNWGTRRVGEQTWITPEHESSWLAMTADGPGHRRGSNANLIVTLHRTIDAQLAILRDGAKRADVLPNLVTYLALDLARAILVESA